MIYWLLNLLIPQADHTLFSLLDFEVNFEGTCAAKLAYCNILMFVFYISKYSRVADIIFLSIRTRPTNFLFDFHSPTYTAVVQVLT